MFRVFPEALDPCFACFTLSRSSPCNAYQWEVYLAGGIVDFYWKLPIGLSSSALLNRWGADELNEWWIEIVMAWLQGNFAKATASYTEVSFLTVVIILILISLSSPATTIGMSRPAVIKEEPGSWKKKDCGLQSLPWPSTLRHRYLTLCRQLSLCVVRLCHKFAIYVPNMVYESCDEKYEWNGFEISESKGNVCEIHWMSREFPSIPLTPL